MITTVQSVVVENSYLQNQGLVLQVWVWFLFRLLLDGLWRKIVLFRTDQLFERYRVRLFGAGGRRFKSGPDKLEAALPTVRHRCDIFSNGAVLPGRNEPEMRPANSLQASA